MRGKVGQAAGHNQDRTTSLAQFGQNTKQSVFSFALPAYAFVIVEPYSPPISLGILKKREQRHNLL